MGCARGCGVKIGQGLVLTVKIRLKNFSDDVKAISTMSLDSKIL